MKSKVPSFWNALIDIMGEPVPGELEIRKIKYELLAKLLRDAGFPQLHEDMIEDICTSANKFSDPNGFPWHVIRDGNNFKFLSIPNFDD